MLVEEGTKDLRNVKLIASSDYAVSRATFPTYFLKDKCTASVAETQAELDATLFANLFVPELSIKKRFVGTEPFCPITAKYNEMMKKVLPPRGVEIVEIKRPMPSVLNRNRQAAKNSSGMLPTRGISNQ